MTRRMLFGLLGVAAVVVAGCNSGATSGTSSPCGFPVGTSSVLVYPAPGATGIPDNVSVIVLGSTAALPGAYGTLLVNNSSQNSVFFNQVAAAPNPLPLPNAIPSFANPVYQSSGNPQGSVTFVAGSSVSVYLNNTSGACTPTLLLGTFTVQ